MVSGFLNDEKWWEEEEGEGDEVEASLDREDKFFKSYEDRGINPFEPTEG